MKKHCGVPLEKGVVIGHERQGPEGVFWSKYDYAGQDFSCGDFEDVFVNGKGMRQRKIVGEGQQQKAAKKQAAQQQLTKKKGKMDLATGKQSANKPERENQRWLRRYLITFGMSVILPARWVAVAAVEVMGKSFIGRPL